jgi:two-component system sensor histidine kinase PhoQ
MRSLSARVSLSAGFVLAIFVILTGVALDRAFHDSARSARQDRLQAQLYLLIAAAEVDARGTLSMPATLTEAKFSLPGSGLYADVTDSTGNVVWRSTSSMGVAPPFQSRLRPGEQRFDELSDKAGQPFYVQSMGVNWASGGAHHAFTFSVSEDLAEVNAQLGRYRRSLWGWLGAMAALLLAAQAAVLRWGLRPLRGVAAELAAIEAGRQERLKGEYPREIGQLTDNLNTLLAHERASQKRYRDALADLAHSLKTPLAVMRGALGGGSKQQLDATVEEEVMKMDSIVAYQLQRAATAGRSSRLAAPVAIRPIATKIVASLAKVYRDKAVEAAIAINDGAVFRGDEGDLMELLGNLLDNAYKWCRSTVRIAVNHDGALVVTVEDDGPGMDPQYAQQLLQRGVRADQAVPGHGIGLAIARDIVQAYQGEIGIARSDLGGAAVRVALPAR